ncbi:hypothetical protein RND81_04G243700 [Saponaria officinalis]|uniref:AN1-type domain-containing protein n=1 Tax=Saponaria officinalis TaxID=3572 RepID=A0AAW1LPE4_SAPOF
MAQNRDTDDTFDLKLCKNLPTTTTATATATPTTSGYGSSVHGHGPESARIDRGDEAQPRSGHVRPDPTRETEERKRSATDTGSGGEPAKRAVNRCSGCRKRVGLTGFRCRCGDLFCAEHRYSDRHDCSYDYKSAGRVAIARENPVVRAAKILKV